MQNFLLKRERVSATKGRYNTNRKILTLSRLQQTRCEILTVTKTCVSSLESLILTPENTASTSVNYYLFNYKKPHFSIERVTAYYQVLTCSIHDEAVNNPK